MTIMHIGRELWSDKLTGDMVQKQVSGAVSIWTYPDLPKSIYVSFETSVKRFPSKIALVDDDGSTYSYEMLYEKVKDFYVWLYQKKNVRRGQHVALMLYNSVEFCVAFLALNKLGAVVVPLPTKYRKEEVHSLVTKSDVRLIISDKAFSAFFSDCAEMGIALCVLDDENRIEEYKDLYSGAREALEHQNEADESDLALIMFTSGTTSQSKGVTIRNYNIMHAIVSYERTLGITEKDRAIIPVPIYLITGLVAVFGLMMHVGGTVYLNRFFEAKRVLSDIKKYEISFLHASPTIFTMLLEEIDAFSLLPSLRLFACGSSNMPPEKIRRLHKWLPHCEFRTVYGLTETTSPATVFPGNAGMSEYIGSSGIPIPGLDFKIVDESGEEVLTGIEGRILVKGSNITEAYYKIQTELLQNGWLDTGDIGYFNREGYLYIVDRKKDMINRGGEKICSFDVENELVGIPQIEDAAVAGILDELYGEVPVAVVKLRAGCQITETEIKRILKQKMAGYKVPVKILFVDYIPVTQNMKTDKKKIRQLFG